MADEKLGNADEALQIRDGLSRESTYYGFLAADRLNRPYSICPVEPTVTRQAIADLRMRPDISRALELRAAGLQSWAQSEWALATSRLDTEGLRSAAALAREESWHDRVIFSLGDSGDRQYYDWRFPLLWEQQVSAESAFNQIDPSWVHGVMRSESALSESARSSAGALGLMQITPATARRLSRKHGMPYKGTSQLREADLNIRFGTRFMRELLDRYDQNPVLVSGAYNAGPEAVDRWLGSRPRGEADAWIETIPYYETRDYIPRVLAFTAIYDWRMQQPVTRVSSRMPDLDSGNMINRQTTEVVCITSG
jgi:soluble lytic murein transglycosylase